MKRLVAQISFFICFHFWASGQNTLKESYFATNTPKVGGYIKASIKTPDRLIIHASIPHRTELPDDYIAVISSDGILLWNSFNWPVDSTLYRFGAMAIDQDSLLYLTTVEGLHNYLMQINYWTGKVLWKTPLPAGYQIKKIRKRSSAEVSLSARNLTTYKDHFLFCSTTDGSITTNFPTAQASVGDMFFTDDTGFYYAYKDTVVKTKKNALNQVIWKSRMFVPGLWEIKSISDVVPNPSAGSAILIGESNNDKASTALMRLANGEITGLAHSQLTLTLRVADWLINGDTLFSCLETTGSGSLSNQFSVMATLRSTGARLYNKSYYIDKPGTTTPFLNLTYRSVNLARDNAGYLYLNGYIGSYTGIWGVVKVKSWNGEKVWTKVMDDTPMPGVYDQYSAGKIAWFTGNQKFWLGGEMQTYRNNPYPVLYEMDLSDFSIKNTRYLSGNYQYQSSLQRLLPGEKGDFFTLKQLDNCGEVSRYDADHQIKWRFPICEYQRFKAISFSKGFGGQLYVLGVDQQCSAENNSSFYDTNIHVFKLNAETGALNNHYQIPLTNSLFGQLMLSCQTDTTIVYFHESLTSKYVRIINNQVLDKQDLGGNLNVLTGDLDERFRLREKGRKTVIRLGTGNQLVMTPNNKQSVGFPFSLFTFKVSTIDGVPNSDHLIAGGEQTNVPSNWGLLRYVNLNLPTRIWQKTGTIGKISKVVAGNGDLLFTEGVIGNQIFVKRFSLATGNTRWEKTITLPDGLPKINDLAYDSTSNQILLGGSLIDPKGLQRIYLLKLDTSGRVITQLTRSGDGADGPNEIIEIQALGSGGALVGGQTQRAGIGKAGFVWALPQHINTGSGKVFVDLNDNAQLDSTEYPFRQTVHISPGNYFSFPDSSGAYLFAVLNDGAYEAQIQSPSPYFDIKPAKMTFGASQNSVQGADIRLVPNVDILDGGLALHELSAPRFGSFGSMLASFKNNGTRVIDSAEISLDCGPNFELTALAAVSYEQPVKHLRISGSTLQAGISGIPPLQERHYVAYGKLNTFMLPGDTVVCYGRLTTTPQGEATLLNNVDTVYMTVVGAYDPNDVTAYPGDEVPTKLLDTDGSLDLTYRIRFQNTGNAATRFVRIENQYSPLLEPGQFVLGATSAPCEVRFLDEQKIEFLFKNYALAPAKLDSAKSEGFVFYQIKSRDGLQVGDSIFNSAAIYFDFNPPIITNKAVSYLGETSSFPDISAEKNQFSLYPNPCRKGDLVQFSNLFKDLPNWWLYGESGRLIRSGTMATGINTQGLLPGAYLVWCKGKSKWLIVTE